MSRFRGQKIEEETVALFELKKLMATVRGADIAGSAAFSAVAAFVHRHDDAPSEACTLPAAALHKLMCSQLSTLPGRPKADDVQRLLHDDPEKWSVAGCWTAARVLHRTLHKQLKAVAGPNSPLHAETFQVAAQDWVVLRAVYESLARLQPP